MPNYFNPQIIKLLIIVLFGFTLNKLTVDCGEVDYCYSDIGCFPLSAEFYHPRHRPFNVRPWHRSKIRTRFELYNRQFPDGHLLRPWNKLDLINSQFNPSLETKIIIPGWLDNIRRATWVKRLKEALLWNWHPVNIIVVHWRNLTPYTIATANTRVVGAELANMLKSIENLLNYDRSYHHLIGHSLGAHIGGYCGDRLPGLGRITALDPARPFFQGMPKSVRLDRGDAKFVDAIHSDFTPENAIFLLMSYGMTTPVGHLDFYPNGPPLLQPGCIRDTLLSVQRGIQKGLEHSSISVAFFESIRYLTACDHQRSHEWFLESITNRECVFVGVRCNEFEGLINGRCTCDNSKSACAIMGIHADQMYINQAHKDLWPSAIPPTRPKETFRRPPPTSPAPVMFPMGHIEQSIYEQLSRPDILIKDEIYGHLKQQAEHMRYPQQPSISIMMDSPIEEQYNGLHNMQDVLFARYLRSTFMTEEAHPIRRPVAAAAAAALPQGLDFNLVNFLQNPSIQSSPFDRRQGNNGDEDYLLSGHPKLMSGVDHDIETWYEDSSRWFLKTNNRPNYCVNQYQVLVFLGPLRTTSGQKRIRANLIISIIGSKGQLMNQRFVPRSASLDSNTMQPFFILLEGSYSLGDIISVAVGWEARLDPDPIQATISFQSSPLLESIQASIPTYKARHPLIAKPFEYDHSDSFRWTRPSRPGQVQYRSQRRIGSLEGVSGLEKSMELLHEEEQLLQQASPGCSLQEESIGQCFSQGDIYQIMPSLSSSEPKMMVGLMVNNNTNLFSDQIVDSNNEEEFDTEESIQIQASPGFKQHFGIPQLSLPRSTLDTTSAVSHISLRDIATSPEEMSILQELLEPMQLDETRFNAELHNIHIHADRDLEDSIIINQVIVSPLHATYGKSGRVGKTFCPSGANNRLRKDQTIRLKPVLMGKCLY